MLEESRPADKLYDAVTDRLTSPAALQVIYTCPMHPQIVRDQPGTCPICGMKLERVVKPVE